ncbi:MAG: tetratricopeptide repeat protein [Gammaproteobacteria bacterium WSBS_2016_MAG_OTU1]
MLKLSKPPTSEAETKAPEATPATPVAPAAPATPPPVTPAASPPPSTPTEKSAGADAAKAVDATKAAASDMAAATSAAASKAAANATAELKKKAALLQKEFQSGKVQKAATEAATEAATTSLYKTISFFAAIIEYRLAILIGVATLVVFSVGAKIGVDYYINGLLQTGINEIRQGKFEDSVTHLNRYINFQEERDPEAELWLARAHIFQSKTENIGSLLGGTGYSKPETNYIRAMANLSKSLSDASRILRIPANPQLHKGLGKTHPYVFAADGIIKLLAGDYVGAVDPLNIAADNITGLPEEDTFIANNYMRSLYPIFTRRQNLEISQEVDVAINIAPEDNLKLFQQLGFSIDTNSFINYYDIQVSEILADLSTSESISEEFRALALLAQVLSNPDNAPSIINTFFESHSSNTLLAKYLAGYHYAINGDYEQSAQFYRDINNKLGSSKSFAYQAAAAWQAQTDSPIPTDEVVLAYEEATRLGPNNIHAINNYALMEVYRNNTDKAASIISRAALSSNQEGFNAYASLNYAIIGIIQNNLADVDKHIKDLEQVIEKNPELALAFDIMTELHLLKGEFLDAVTFLNRNLILQPDNPTIPLKISDIYRHNERLFLSTSAMLNGYRNFPSNVGVIEAHIISNSRVKNRKQVASILKESNIPSDSAIGLYARSLLILNDPAESAKLADSALALAKGTSSQKINMALDAVRFHLLSENAESARAAWNIADDLVQNTVTNKNYPLVLRAMELWIDVVANGGAESTAPINELLLEADLLYNIPAKFDLYLALIAAGDTNAVITTLEVLEKEAIGYPARLLHVLNIAYATIGNSDKLDSVVNKIQNIESESETLATQEERLSEESKVFVNNPDSEGHPLLEKIDSAVAVENYPKAIELYTQLINEADLNELFETPALSFQNRGALYISTKEYELAADDFKTALSMKDSRMTEQQEVAINYNLANTLIYGGFVQEAENLLKDLLDNEIHEEHFHVYLRMLAYSANKQGRAEEAKELYQQLLDSYPTEGIGVIGVYFAIANIARVQRDYSLVVQTLNQALEIEPNNIKIHRALISAYTQLGDTENVALHKQVLDDISSQ